MVSEVGKEQVTAIVSPYECGRKPSRLRSLKLIGNRSFTTISGPNSSDCLE